MKWEEIQHKPPLVFNRLVGIEKPTFELMADELVRLSPASKHKVSGKKRGPKPKLSIENRLLMMLMYYREYRTFLHIASDYGISEAQCWRIITQTEELLIKSRLFHLPGKKALLLANNFEVVLVDVTETPIERPKKNSVSIIQERRKGTP